MSMITINTGDGPVKVDLDQLTPKARALAECVAERGGLGDIWMEADRPQRETLPDWQLWLTEEEADRPERRPWRGWALTYGQLGKVDIVDYLEREARKIPAGWHPLGARPDRPVSSRDAAAADQRLDRSQTLAYLRSRGRNIATSTWSAYVARGQAPGPADHVGRTPLWDRAELDMWLATRPERS